MYRGRPVLQQPSAVKGHCDTRASRGSPLCLFFFSLSLSFSHSLILSFSLSLVSLVSRLVCAARATRTTPGIANKLLLARQCRRLLALLPLARDLRAIRRTILQTNLTYLFGNTSRHDLSIHCQTKRFSRLPIDLSESSSSSSELISLVERILVT